jgi:alpha-1,6-mannosyltransferase
VFIEPKRKQEAAMASGMGDKLAIRSLHRYVNVLGAVALAAYLSMTAASYYQAPALWQAEFAPRATAYFTWMHGAENLAAIRDFFGGALAVLLSHFVPLILCSAAPIILLVLLNQAGPRRNTGLGKLILRWGFAFTAASLLAFPVFTQDFWLSAVWGNMVVAGVNPYYVDFTPEMIGSLPLDHFPMTMSYGPLWALMSGGIMLVAGGNVLVAGLLFKLILAAAWVATLLLVDSIMRKVLPSQRLQALVIAGWVPLGVWETVGEGHNDVVMVVPALLWIALMLRKHFAGPLALAASVLCKYTTAPLLLIDVLHTLRSSRLRLSEYALRLALAGVVTLAITAIFYRSMGFFDGVKLVSTWHFLRPVDALAALDEMSGGWLYWLRYPVAAIFPAIAFYQCLLYWKRPEDEQMLRAALGVMCAVSFSMISHLWPWYLVWTLVFAAFAPSWWLSRFVIGLALLAPVTAFVWWIPEVEDYKNFAALIMYASAALGTVIPLRSEAKAAKELPAVIHQLELARVNGKPVSKPRAAHYDAGLTAEPQLQAASEPVARMVS